MTPDELLHSVILPAEAAVPPALVSPEARCLLVAMAGQESGWSTRVQLPIGYARGYWQCERAGAVLSVMSSSLTTAWATAACAKFDVPASLVTVYEAIAWHDQLAYCVARLALWPDQAPLPVLGDEAGAWSYYERNWRPGKPRPETWHERYSAALALFPTS
jgi:hypothetical protein